MFELSKCCTQCKELKPLSEFHRKSSARDGRRSSCALCDSERNMARYPLAVRQTVVEYFDMEAVGAALVGWRGPVSVGAAPMARAW